MADTYVKATRALTVPLADATHRALLPGEPISKDELSEHAQDQLENGDDYFKRCFESSSQKDKDEWDEGHRTYVMKDFDRDRLNEMENVVLPGPDEVAVIDGDDLAVVKREEAPQGVIATSHPTEHKSSAVTVDGAEADELKNADVGTSGEPSPSPADKPREELPRDAVTSQEDQEATEARAKRRGKKDE